jgi:Zn finger protein HypA/HybF involved in hydrogenase expression
MFRLPFKCLNCDYDFKTIDEHVVICPECKSDDVIVDWDKEENE